MEEKAGVYYSEDDEIDLREVAHLLRLKRWRVVSASRNSVVNLSDLQIGANIQNERERYHSDMKAFGETVRSLLNISKNG